MESPLTLLAPRTLLRILAALPTIDFVLFDFLERCDLVSSSSSIKESLSSMSSTLGSMIDYFLAPLACHAAELCLAAFLKVMVPFLFKKSFPMDLRLLRPPTIVEKFFIRLSLMVKLYEPTFMIG